MNAQDLKVGFPLYYINSTKLKFDNVIIHEIKRVDIINYSVYRISLVECKSDGYSYLGFTDVKLDDKVYITKDEFVHRMVESESAPGITFYEENTMYWTHNKKELRKIKINSIKYRIHKTFNKIVYGTDLRRYKIYK